MSRGSCAHHPTAGLVLIPQKLTRGTGDASYFSCRVLALATVVELGTDFGVAVALDGTADLGKVFSGFAPVLHREGNFLGESCTEKECTILFRRAAVGRLMELTERKSFHRER